MSDLRANTDLMRQGANTLDSVQVDFHKLLIEINTAVNSIDKSLYEGQLAQKVAEIMAGTIAQGGKIESSVGEVAKSLLKKATEIEMVNAVSSTSVLNIANDLTSLGSSPQAQASAQLRSLNIEEGNVFLILSGFIGGISYLLNKQSFNDVNNFYTNTLMTPLAPKGYFITTSVNLYDEPGGKNYSGSPLIGGKFVIKTDEKTLENGKTWYKIEMDGGRSGWVPSSSITQATMKDSSKTRGEQVPTGEDGKDFQAEGGSYSRYSYGDKEKSNCTYYAASAVYTNSDGRVQVDSLHDGGNWATNVQKKINDYGANNVPIENRKYLGVDRVPAAGDVYCNDSSHVAFVEQTWVSNDGKKVFVVVSEENAGTPALNFIGAPVGQKVTAIAEASGIKRFRSVFVFDNATKDASNPSIAEGHGRFIHINYNYQPGQQVK